MHRAEFFQHLSQKLSSEELRKIYDAYWLSKVTHRGQFRDDGTRYFEHPKDVAAILFKECGIYDPNMIIVLLLHDAFEDTYLPKDVVETIFGDYVYTHIQLLSKSVKVLIEATGELKETKKRLNYYLEIANGGDQLIAEKTCDRIGNLRTMGIWSVEKREAYIKESEEILLPMISKTRYPQIALLLQLEIEKQKALLLVSI